MGFRGSKRLLNSWATRVETEIRLDRTADTLAGEFESGPRAEHLVDQVAESQLDLGETDVGAGMPRQEFEHLVVDPLDPREVLADPAPEVALGIEGLAVGALHHEADVGHHAVRRILHDVEVGPGDADAVAGEQSGASLERCPRPGVPEDHGDPAERGIGFALEFDDGAVGPAHAFEELVVMRDPERRERPDVVSRAVPEVGLDRIGRPVRAVGGRPLDGLVELRALPRVVAVEGLGLAELEGVEDDLAVEARVDLRGPERVVHRQVLDDLGEHARVVVGADRGPDRAVLADQRHVDGTMRGAGGHDRLEVAELRRVVGVLEVHPRHLVDEPRDDGLGHVAEAADEFVDELLGFGMTRRLGRLIGGGGSHRRRSSRVDPRSREAPRPSCSEGPGGYPVGPFLSGNRHVGSPPPVD